MCRAVPCGRAMISLSAGAWRSGTRDEGIGRGGVGHAMGVNRMWRSWRIIQYDVFELSEESGEVVGTFATENAEDRGDHLELERFQFSFFRLFRRVEPI